MHFIETSTYALYNDNCLNVLAQLPDNSVDSIVTDPPYGLSFMGKKWDYDVPSTEIWQECLRVLKPGGHLLAFAGTRTQHRMAVNIEDAGFEIRDMIAWVYGSGFPKSHNIGKAIDKVFGAEREVVLSKPQSGAKFKLTQELYPNGGFNDPDRDTFDITAPVTEEAKKWEGWGTALKPALEPITVARKPFKGPVANNVLTYGTGAINIDECRVGNEKISSHNAPKGTFAGGEPDRNSETVYREHEGRWPANLIHDGSEEVLDLFPETKSGKMTSLHKRTTGGSPNGIYGKFDAEHPLSETYGDSGSAARFFYCAKASKRDRDEGLEGFEVRQSAAMAGNLIDGGRLSGDGKPIATPLRANVHPTVKPTELMRYLCRLVTPPNGVILDPFMGSGSTGKAAMLEDFRFIGIDMQEEYFYIAKSRIEHAKNSN